MGGGCSEVPFNVLKLLQVWTVLLAFSPAMSGYSWSSTAKSVVDHNLGLSPVFDDFTIREVEATEGQTLLLPCTVRYLGDKVVSWIRSRDLHILTSGRFTFSSDNRFEPVPSPAGDFWGLRIRGVLLSDTGRYECQVNTDPKMSLAFNLTGTLNPKKRRLKAGVVPTQKIPTLSLNKSMEEKRRKSRKRLLHDTDLPDANNLAIEVGNEDTEGQITKKVILSTCIEFRNENRKTSTHTLYGKEKEPLLHINFVKEETEKFVDKSVRKLEDTNSKWVGQALIKGRSEVYVRDGSPVTFTCEISPLSVASPQSGAHGVFMTAKPKVRWLHDNKELLFETTDPHISMRTLYGEMTQKVIGVLKISKVSWRDSGQYTCLQMSVKPYSVKLFVAEREHSEAMQRDFPMLSTANQCFLHLGYVFLMLLYFPT
ncbi:hypothetical protein Zmor_001458 [Zophobas morio]|uniref:Ig-like domain-containing protein n=1 Tax=Zophobas morio TaxID=2755281 RepID=A0AA38J5C0_9CUCU|nr:hypothetical protein Zmor_001458 [Zophobas morio]